MIDRIKLKNYRNYSDYTINFDKNINIIIGNNGIGKTNILESIFTLLITKSFKKIKEKDLIYSNQPYFRLEGDFGDLNLSFYYDEAGKKVFRNDIQLKKISDYISEHKIIFYGPDEIFLLKGTPKDRRKYFNMQISQYDNNYLSHLINYQKIIKNKNNYLKNNVLDNALLDSYNEQLLESMLYLIVARKQYIELINKKINNNWNMFYPKTKINLQYSIKNSKIENITKEGLKQYLEKLKISEQKYKTILFGPHLDDFNFNLNDDPVINKASEGQLRLVIMSLKLSELDLLLHHGYTPIILLDDLFGELDIKNSNKLLSVLDKQLQIIITTTDIKKIEKNILEKANIINLQKEEVR